LKYDVIYGPTYREIFSRYNEMAGRRSCRRRGRLEVSGGGTIIMRIAAREECTGKTIEDADKLRALHIPAGAIWLDRPFGTGEMAGEHGF